MFPREVLLFILFLYILHISCSSLHFRIIHSHLQGTLLSLRFGFRSLGLSFTSFEIDYCSFSCDHIGCFHTIGFLFIFNTSRICTDIAFLCLCFSPQKLLAVCCSWRYFRIFVGHSVPQSSRFLSILPTSISYCSWLQKVEDETIKWSRVVRARHLRLSKSGNTVFAGLISP